LKIFRTYRKFWGGFPNDEVQLLCAHAQEARSVNSHFPVEAMRDQENATSKDENPRRGPGRGAQ
jgi:hypothetical protein